MLLPLFGFPLAAIPLTLPVPSQIHVKVFPHLFTYAPQGRDTDPSQVTLKSSSSCKISVGKTGSASPTDQVKSVVPNLDLTLTAKTLSTPLWIECDAPVTVIRKGAAVNYSYSAAIYAHKASSGPELVATLSLNDYLKGVVPSEMPSSWPAEALKAQAVAARTYALYHVLVARSNDASTFYDVDDTVLYQAYTGNYMRTPQTDTAVDSTGGTIILYQGDVIQAYFSADAGGYTEDADHVWSVDAPFCVAKPEEFFDNGLDNGRWQPWVVTFSLDDVNEKLEAQGLLPTGIRALGLQVLDQYRYVSGRMSEVTATLTNGVTRNIDALQFRRALGLKSNLFTIVMTRDHNVEFHGKGFGHGAGMSQLGARLAAMQGNWDYSQILNFYYTNVTLVDPSNN